PPPPSPFERIPDSAVADGDHLNSGGHCQRGRLSYRSASNHMGSAARRRRCAPWQMVTRDGFQPARAARRLKELAINLPPPPEPFGTYVEAVQTGDLLFLTGMLPTEGREA